MEANKIIQGDCVEVLKQMDENSIDTIITDPPYGLSFMGKKWDYDVPSIETFQEMLRVSKPGATLMCFAGTRTQHRMAVNIEDAGWILKDCIMWLYGSGFPKATDISKQLDKGVERKVVGVNQYVARRPNVQKKEGVMNNKGPNLGGPESCKVTEPATPQAKLWNGWKSHGLKPAYEPIIVAMKPNEGSYAQNALKWGVSGLNIDGGRIGHNEKAKVVSRKANPDLVYGLGKDKHGYTKPELDKGRFPANIILECICDEVREGVDPSPKTYTRKSKGYSTENSGMKGVGEPTGKESKNYGGGTTLIHTNPECPCYMLDEQSGVSKSQGGSTSSRSIGGGGIYQGGEPLKDIQHFGDTGGASRFFYVAKASKAERNMGCDGLEEKNFGFSGGANSKVKQGDTEYLQDHIGLNRISKMTNNHPTVKPLALMEYLVRLTKTPTGGTVLDPFAGSGTTCMAAKKQGRDYIGIEREEEYIKIAEARVKAVQKPML